MEIVMARPDQFETARGFYHSLIDAREGMPHYIGWQKDVYPSPDFLRDSAERGELYFAKTDDGALAGAVVLNHECNEGYRNFRWETAAEDGEILVIHALGVHPDYNGRGYAKAMVRAALDIARETGMKTVRLDVLEGNIPAENLYRGLGFLYRGTLQLYYEDTGLTNFRLFEHTL